MQALLKDNIRQIDQQQEVMHLLQLEARLTKKLYKLAAKNTGYDGFTREHEGIDKANGFLNHGNYLAYGLGATTAWTLGIPHGFAVMHGKTRRGALVFDIADIIKDALVLPSPSSAPPKILVSSSSGKSVLICLLSIRRWIISSKLSNNLL